MPQTFIFEAGVRFIDRWQASSPKRQEVPRLLPPYGSRPDPTPVTRPCVASNFSGLSSRVDAPRVAPRMQSHLTMKKLMNRLEMETVLGAFFGWCAMLWMSTGA